MSAAASQHEVARRIRSGLVRRHRRDALFRLFGAAATAAGILFLGVFFVSLVEAGASAFLETRLELDVTLDERLLTVDGSYDPRAANFDAVVRDALQALFPEVNDRARLRELTRLVSIGAAFELRDRVDADPEIIGESVRLAVPASALADAVVKGRIDRAMDPADRPVSDRQLEWIDSLQERGLLTLGFNARFFSNGDSREPELAGIRGALTGSLLMMLITALVSLPLGIAAAVYLEEFAPSSRWTDLVEVNINNLASVPSIIFGLLGLAIFIDLFGMPRSAPLVGGLVLAFLTLPVIIISARAAIGAVPVSIRDAALSVGASRMQVVFDHVVPQALPGILTGAIIGLSRALGETAPLLMIGMVAFVVDVPAGITDPSTALPVQIFLWSESPERGFTELTAAAILVLLAFLLLMNLGAVIIRKRLQSTPRL